MRRHTFVSLTFRARSVGSSVQERIAEIAYVLKWSDGVETAGAIEVVSGSSRHFGKPTGTGDSLTEGTATKKILVSISNTAQSTAACSSVSSSEHFATTPF